MEQLIRAQRLSARGLVDMMHPDDVSADTLAAWITSDAPRRAARPVRMHTAQGFHELLVDALAAAPMRAPVAVRHAS